MSADRSGTATIEVIVDLPNPEAMDLLMEQILELANSSAAVAGKWKS